MKGAWDVRASESAAAVKTGTRRAEKVPGPVSQRQVYLEPGALVHGRRAQGWRRRAAMIAGVSRT